MRDPGRKPCEEELDIMRRINSGNFVPDDEAGLRADIAWLNFYGFVELRATPRTPSDFNFTFGSLKDLDFALTDKGKEAIGKN
jgi:hypothetical protein